MAETGRGVDARVVAVVATLALAVGALGTFAGAAWLGLIELGADGGSTDAAASPPAADVGASGDGYAVWDRNDDGSPVRWDPCAPIELVLAPDGAPDGFRADLDDALAELEAATGLELTVAGTTDERPAADRSPYQPARYGDRWAPVLVAWAPPGEGGVPLRDVDRGVAIPVAVGAPGDRSYVTGQVVFNRDRGELVAGRHDRATSWGATLLHELAHLLGLAHVDDPDELMWTFPGEGPVELGPGDRAGLAAVGAGGGCRPAPPAGEVEVTLPERP